ncbi:MAG: TolB-like protein [Paraglaciecola sp.]
MSLSKTYFTNLTGCLLLVFAGASLGGCSTFTAPPETSINTTDIHYVELKRLLEQQKIEWQTQKPALERLVKNEEDLAFLIDALSQLSVIGNASSLEQYIQRQPPFNQPTDNNTGGKKGGSTIITSERAVGVTGKENPFSRLVGSPNELSALMSELQKLAKKGRYNVLNTPVRAWASSTSGEANIYSGILANSKVQLSDYAGQLASELAKFRALKGARVGVASFVEFDQSLTTTSSLGNQFAEALATELPQYGVQVVDFKLTQHIDVSPRGDLALSRDMQELTTQIDMKYVLTGTLVATNRGVKINSRVVSTHDNSVIAAASTFVPKVLLQQIQP